MLHDSEIKKNEAERLKILAETEVLEAEQLKILAETQDLMAASRARQLNSILLFAGVISVTALLTLGFTPL